MALDKNSNGFTFGFAIILVVVVGAALSLTAMGLKPMQDKNATDKKMIDIIGAVNVQATRANAQEMYTKHVKESFVVDSEGNIKEGVDAFGVDVKKEYKDKGHASSSTSTILLQVTSFHTKNKKRKKKKKKKKIYGSVPGERRPPITAPICVRCDGVRAGLAEPE